MRTPMAPPGRQRAGEAAWRGRASCRRRSSGRPGAEARKARSPSRRPPASPSRSLRRRREHRLEERSVGLAGRRTGGRAPGARPSAGRPRGHPGRRRTGRARARRRRSRTTCSWRTRRSAARGRDVGPASPVDDHTVADLEEDGPRLAHEGDERVQEKSRTGRRSARAARAILFRALPSQGMQSSRAKVASSGVRDAQVSARPDAASHASRAPSVLAPRSPRRRRPRPRGGALRSRAQDPRRAGVGAALARRKAWEVPATDAPRSASRARLDRRPPVRSLGRVLEGDVVAGRRARDALHRVGKPLEEAPELEPLSLRGSRTAIWRRISMLALSTPTAKRAKALAASPSLTSSRPPPTRRWGRRR